MVPETMEPLFFIINFDNRNNASIFVSTKFQKYENNRSEKRLF